MCNLINKTSWEYGSNLPLYHLSSYICQVPCFPIAHYQDLQLKHLLFYFLLMGYSSKMMRLHDTCLSSYVLCALFDKISMNKIHEKKAWSPKTEYMLLMLYLLCTAICLVHLIMHNLLAYSIPQNIKDSAPFCHSIFQLDSKGSEMIHIMTYSPIEKQLCCLHVPFNFSFIHWRRLGIHIFNEGLCRYQISKEVCSFQRLAKTVTCIAKYTKDLNATWGWFALMVT